MFTLNKCIVRACGNLAVSKIDENDNIVADKGYCLDHTPNPGKVTQDILNYIKNHDKIMGLNATGMTFSGIDRKNASSAATLCTALSQTFIPRDLEARCARSILPHSWTAIF